MLRTLDLLASDPSHLPFLFVFKESGVMEKYGFEIDLHIVGGAKAPTMAHRAKLALAGEIDFSADCITRLIASGPRERSG